jgi:glycosyltransferase involved in cell wall biosynthesis
VEKLTGLWIGKTGEANVWYHTCPLALSRHSRHLHIVRYRKPLRDVPGSTVHTFQSRNLPSDMLLMWRCSLKVLREHDIDYIVTFNPIPWGSVAWLAAKYTRKPVILGFIGEDFYTHLRQRWYRPVLLFMARSSDAVTVTGAHMQRHLLAAGLRAEQVSVYPHCVADEWFLDVSPAQGPRYDLITVCQLIPRKRIQDILEALNILSKRGVRPTFCIVGDGPERESLGVLVRENGLEGAVTFAGHIADVRPHLARARVFVQASSQEGFSLGLVEALAAGLVPVASLAGSEEDHIEDGVNGYLVPVGRPEVLAERLAFLHDRKTYDAMRSEVLRRRNRYRLEVAVTACDRILERISRGLAR